MEICLQWMKFSPLTSVIAGFNCISFHADACCYCESATKKSPNFCQLCLRATSQQIKLNNVWGENCPIQLAILSPESPRPLHEESLRLYVQSRASYLIEVVKPSLLQVFEFDQPALDVISEWQSPPSTPNLVAVAHAATNDNNNNDDNGKTAKKKTEDDDDDDDDNDGRTVMSNPRVTSQIWGKDSE